MRSNSRISLTHLHLAQHLQTLQGDNYRRGDGFSTTRSVKKVSDFLYATVVVFSAFRYSLLTFALDAFDCCILSMYLYHLL